MSTYCASICTLQYDRPSCGWARYSANVSRALLPVTMRRAVTAAPVTRSTRTPAARTRTRGAERATGHISAASVACSALQCDTISESAQTAQNSAQNKNCAQNRTLYRWVSGALEKCANGTAGMTQRRAAHSCKSASWQWWPLTTTKSTDAAVNCIAAQSRLAALHCQPIITKNKTHRPITYAPAARPAAPRCGGAPTGGPRRWRTARRQAAMRSTAREARADDCRWAPRTPALQRTLEHETRAKHSCISAQNTHISAQNTKQKTRAS